MARRGGFDRRACLILAACFGLLGGVVVAVAELADVYLKSGLILRGDVTETADEVIVRNAAGEVRVPRDEVGKIVPVEAAATQPETRPTTQKAATRPSTTRPAASRRTTSGPAESEPAPEPGRPEIAGAPLLSARDIQRLKIHELLLQGPAEPVKVRFEKKGKQRDLPVEVLDELKKRTDYKGTWGDILTRGQPHEKLQLIVRETGMKHADRIDIQTDPEVFATFRRRILPLLNKSCARSGCHGGRAAQLFRFPNGSTTSESYAYTCFVLLDQMQTRHTPLISRTKPDESALLAYLLPPEGNERTHPPVTHGPAFKAVLRGRDDPQYAVVTNWIGFLVTVHPDYGLEYKNPYAGLMSAQKGDAASKDEKKAGAESRPASQPQSQPAGEAQSRPGGAESKPAGGPVSRPAREESATKPVAPPGG